MEKQVILFGAGYAGVCELYRLGSEKVYCFADNNKTGHVAGKEIISFEKLIATAANYDIVISTENTAYTNELAKQLIDAGIPFYTRLYYEIEQRLRRGDVLSIEPEGLFTITFADFVKRFKPESFALVGAAYGGYACIARYYMSNTSKLYIFEPMPQFYHYLFDCFGYDERVQIIRKAVSNNTDKTNLHATIKYDGYDILHSYTIDDKQTMFKNDYEYDDIKLTATVSTVVLDDFFIETDVDLMLLDIEGAEVFAIEGMEKLISKRKTTFFIEVHEPYVRALRKDGMDYITSVFKKNNYHFYWCKLTDKDNYITERGGIQVVLADEIKWEHCIISPNPISDDVLKSWVL